MDMKRLVLAVMCAAASVLSAAAAPLPRFLGIEFGQELDVHDEAVLKSYGLGKPVTVTRYPEKKTYYQCDSTAPKDGFDSFSVDVSLDGKVFCISAEVMCKDRDEASRKTKEISADLKKRYGDRVDENGKVLLEVSPDMIRRCGRKCVQEPGL